VILMDTEVLGTYVADVKCLGYGCFVEINLGSDMAKKNVFVVILNGGRRILRGWYFTDYEGKLHVEVPKWLGGKRVSVIVKSAHPYERW